MYLTDKKNGVPRKANDHEELEVLLESFSKQVEEIVNEAENIQVSPTTCLLSRSVLCVTVSRFRRTFVSCTVALGRPLLCSSVTVLAVDTALRSRTCNLRRRSSSSS